MKHVRLIAAMVAMLAAPAIAHGAATQQTSQSLFDRLGGRAAIVAVVDDFVANVAGDARINKFFAATAGDAHRLAAFKGKLVDQICEAAGGPCRYMGLDMKAAHKGMGVGAADFDALVDDLARSLQKFKVAAADQKVLLGVLGPMKADIVEKK